MTRCSTSAPSECRTIITFFVVYSFGMLIGQDIWQRVFTARSPGVAKWGGTTAALYCVLYGVAGAVIGMAASTFLPDVEAKDDVYAQIAETILPVGHQRFRARGCRCGDDVDGVGCADRHRDGREDRRETVAVEDHWSRRRSVRKPERDVHSDRLYVVVLGIVVIVIAALLNDVVAALTIAYDILVGGLLVAILGGFLWKRATGTGALWSMGVGTVVTLGTMFVVGDVLANEPIYYGLGASLIVYVIASLLTPRTSPEVLAVWDDRLAGRDEAEGRCDVGA